MPLELIATKWLIAGFVNSFPPSTALRILEVKVVYTGEGIGVLNFRVYRPVVHVIRMYTEVNLFRVRRGQERGAFK